MVDRKHQQWVVLVKRQPSLLTSTHSQIPNLKYLTSPLTKLEGMSIQIDAQVKY